MVGDLEVIHMSEKSPTHPDAGTATVQWRSDRSPHGGQSAIDRPRGEEAILGGNLVRESCLLPAD